MRRVKVGKVCEGEKSQETKIGQIAGGKKLLGYWGNAAIIGGVGFLLRNAHFSTTPFLSPLTTTPPSLFLSPAVPQPRISTDCVFSSIRDDSPTTLDLYRLYCRAPNDGLLAKR